VVASRKSCEALRTISQVAEELHVPMHVIRFWETRFPELNVIKRNDSRRYYQLVDVELLRGIQVLLCGHGYIIKGVQKILRERV
jgi:DNA-binding transcriptional MerR regulator